MNQLVDPEAPAPRVKLGSLEIGRFIAASIVVLAHVQSLLAPHMAPHSHRGFADIAYPGSIAVQFFFVLSGFVMMTAHHRDFGSAAAVPKFWWRRVCRIYPMYWIALLLPCYFFRDLLTPGLLARLITLQPVFGGDYVAPAWSLRYEVSFYILFGLCLLPYTGRFLLAAWAAAVFWVACPVAWRHFVGLPPPHLLVWLCFHGFSGFFTFFEFYFFAGLAGGWMFQRGRLSSATGIALIAIGIMGIAIQLPAMDWGFAFGHPIVPIFVGPAFAGIVVGCAVLEQHGILRTGKLAGWLGALSYPLYILHADLILIYDRQFSMATLSPRRWWFAATAALAAIYGVSALFTFLVDQPLQRFLRGRRHGKTSRSFSAQKGPAPREPKNFVKSDVRR